LAHEGHDKTPGAVTAPHGGQIKGGDQHFVEVVFESSNVRVYIFDHDMKKVDLKALKIDGTLKLPKASKPSEVKLNANGDFFEGKVEVKGAHRFALDLTINHESKKEKFTFNIEP
jgi:hypothetical protein